MCLGQQFACTSGLRFATISESKQPDHRRTRAQGTVFGARRWEEDLAAWFAGGMEGPPPDEPFFPDGMDFVSIQGQETGKGAIVGHISESGLYIEVWTLDDPENRLDVGPCTDTDDQGVFLASGSPRTRHRTMTLSDQGPEATPLAIRAKRV